ncbi:MAG: hypothetical protein U1E15_09320 [Hyphomicrobiales bacterium]
MTDYKWLKVENWQQMHDLSLLPADIRTYIEAERLYVVMMAGNCCRTLPMPIGGRIAEDDQSVPSPDGPYVYSTAYVTGGQYPLFKRTLKVRPEELPFDCNALAAGGAYFSLGGMARSPDQARRLVAG